MNKMRSFRVERSALMALAFLVFMASCSLNNDSPGNSQPVTPVSYVSLYNASPDAPALRVSVDNKYIGSGLRYGDYSGYIAFRTGERTLQFGPSNADNVTVDTTLTLAEGKVYSLFVADQYSKVSLFVTDDTSPDPPAGKAMIRLVNLSPDAGPMQLNLKNDGSSLIAARNFKQASAFTEISADNFDLEVSQASGSLKLSVPGVTFQPGKFYSIVVQGYSTPPSGNTNVLSAQVIVN
ncbi:MAG TPA: DUF4397 domain-containing protein [Cyclobacteriaceae bacterium]|nr:DUF4397 domain-containing protein [Cyclobacteriaceae bacterium]